jgi:hypothetical protein
MCADSMLRERLKKLQSNINIAEIPESSNSIMSLKLYKGCLQ